MDLDKGTVQKVQAGVHEAVEQLVAEQFPDLKLLKGSRATYDPTTGEIRLTLNFRVEGEDAERKAFHAGAGVFRLKDEAYGYQFKVRGETYTLVGFDFGRRRYPIVVKDSKGGRRIFEQRILDQIPDSLKVPFVMPEVRCGWCGKVGAHGTDPCPTARLA